MVIGYLISALIGLFVLYFVIKFAVRDALGEFLTDRKDSKKINPRLVALVRQLVTETNATPPTGPLK